MLTSDTKVLNPGGSDSGLSMQVLLVPNLSLTPIFFSLATGAAGTAGASGTHLVEQNYQS